MFVRMEYKNLDGKVYDPYMKKQLESMAEDIFDMQYAFGECSLSYMMLQHARDCLLAVTELNILDDDMPL